MGTTWVEIISNYGLLAIEDIRLEEELRENPAAFLRKMALYMKSAIPRFNQPPGMQSFLKYTEPKYTSYEWTSDGTNMVSTGVMGYELCCATLIEQDKFGNPCTSPLECEYAPDAGDVTIKGLETGKAVSFDFYTDGCFDNELSGEEKRILGLCLQEAWENRFTGNWLDRTPKAKDKSFEIGNEANQLRANSERLKIIRGNLDTELERYARNLAYRKRFPGGGHR